uniref:HHLA1 neighbor of OC90 n=1 Tax=Crocodylus porosus TaxID=8502 RepID=A0A7M4EWW7_CROPO
MYHNSQETMAGRAPVCHSSVKVVSERLSFFTAACLKGESKKEKKVAVNFLPLSYIWWFRKAFFFPEVPAKSVDLTAINLTELVNGMLNTAFKGTKKFFSLLSITSYSSFAFHKVSVLIYNISNLKIVDPSKFPMRYCYCLNNMTNDLTDFTALLVDIIGNSTSYLTEIFKSTSILSVSQSNNSDCIYICVMTGQTGRNLSDFWEMIEKSPVINYTFSSNASADLGKSPHSPALEAVIGVSGCSWQTPHCTVWGSGDHPPCLAPTWQLAHGAGAARLSRAPCTGCRSGDWGLWALVAECPMQRGAAGSSRDPRPPPPGTRPAAVASSGCSTARQSLAALSPSDPSSQAARGTLLRCAASVPRGYLPHRCQAGGGRSVISFLGCPQTLKASPVTSPPVTVLVQKINPCVMELCRFFQQCLCVSQRRYPRQESMRYCIEYYSWFLKNATFICARVKRMAYSNTLKQKCLANICKSI